MADDDSSQTAPKRPPIFRFRFIPLPQRSPALRADEEIQRFREALSSIRRTCPNDGSFLRIDNIIDAEADYVQTSEGETQPVAIRPEPALVCPQCGFTLRIETLIEEAQADASHMKRSENLLVSMAFVLGLGCALMSYLTSNVFLLIGGGLFALILFVQALLMRYRHWQAIHSRMFEARSPFRDWLRQEFRS